MYIHLYMHIHIHTPRVDPRVEGSTRGSTLLCINFLLTNIRKTFWGIHLHTIIHMYVQMQIHNTDALHMYK